jgi:hypothetical protein
MPPMPPAGPVPAPLPNTAFASDLSGAATTVRIGGQPVGHAESYMDRSIGDEPALPPPAFGGVVSHVKNGEARFVGHAMDVFIEGKPAIAHGDLMLHDCGPQPNTGPWPFLQGTDFARLGAMRDRSSRVRAAHDERPCGPGRTRQPLLPLHGLVDRARQRLARLRAGCGDALVARVPGLCVDGESWHTKERKTFLDHFGPVELEHLWAVSGGPDEERAWSYDGARAAAVAAARRVSPDGAMIVAHLDHFWRTLTGNDSADLELRCSTRRRAAPALPGTRGKPLDPGKL